MAIFQAEDWARGILWKWRCGWHQSRERRDVKRVQRELQNQKDPVFTSDYHTRHAEIWQHVLASFRGKPDLRALEIGAYEGRSAIWLLENIWTHPSSEIVCVDRFCGNESSHEVRFDHNIRCKNLENRVRKLKGTSHEIVSQLENAPTFDLIYIDGSHYANDVALDALLCWPRLKNGGLLIFDDYLWEPQFPATKRPQMAVDAFLELARGQYEELHRDWQIIVRKI